MTCWEEFQRAYESDMISFVRLFQLAEEAVQANTRRASGFSHRVSDKIRSPCYHLWTIFWEFSSQAYVTGCKIPQ